MEAIPDDPAARLREIGQILAAGLMRLRLRKSSRLVQTTGESLVDFSPAESVHAAPIWTFGAGQ